MAGSLLGECIHLHTDSAGSDLSQSLLPAKSDDSEDTFVDDLLNMATTEKEDVNEVLDDVIVKINRITDHLREAGENEAANRFTHEMTNTLKNLYNIIAAWDMEQCLMRCAPTSKSVKDQMSNGEVLKHEAKAMGAPSPGTTWAAIAAKEPATDRNGIIKFRPTDSVQVKISQKDSGGSQNNIADDSRVVWIRPWTATRPLSEVTERMQNIGAIYSMAFAPEATAVCIIFQHATSAGEFMHRCAAHLDRYGISLFGPDHDVAPGLPYTLTKDLSRMLGPYMERRRLTFARAGLFNKEGGINQERFRNDIEEVVGLSNVELLWFFNSGNATVVLSAVPLARLVRDTFLGYGRSKSSPYCGVMIGYSHDPCERDMHLVSQIPGHPGYLGGASLPAPGSRPRLGTATSTGSVGVYGQGGSSYFGAAQKRRNPNTSSPKAAKDDEGWQTVKKRR